MASELIDNGGPAASGEESLPATVSLECRLSDGFAGWIAASQGSVAVSAPLSGQVTVLGWNGTEVTLLSRAFDKPMGMALRAGDDGGHSPTQLAIACRRGIVVLANASQIAGCIEDSPPGSFDSLFLPRLTYHTGDINAHDLAFCGDELWVANTAFSCVATTSDQFTFVPRWKPSFVSEMAPEDRCHLNGLCSVDGVARYITCLGATDSVGGWRSGKASGGLLVDVLSDEVICRELCMPHSPRWHDGRLWVLNSGRGELLTIDAKTGRHEVVCALPAYVRGLSFVGNVAVVGMSHVRQKYLYAGLPIQQKHRVLISGIALVDVCTGQQIGTFEFTAGVSEVFEATFLPRMCRTMVFNLAIEAERQVFATPDFSFMHKVGLPSGTSAEIAA